MVRAVPRRIPLVGVAVVLAAVAVGAAMPTASSGSKGLEAITEKLAREYKDVRQMPAGELSGLLESARQSVVLLDVRSPEENAVSQIPGATRIDPGSPAGKVLAAAGDIKGKTVVFYCSVGARSGRLASSVQDALKAKGAAGVANLYGGIFGWHNQSRPLEQAGKPTAFVHPYNAQWAASLDHPGLARMTPEAAAGTAAR